MEKFKRRHSLKTIVLHGEKSSADTTSAELFKETFQDLLQTYDEDDIYNADESGLLWRSLPNRTIITKEEQVVRGFKGNKERITVMCCANASGKHRTTLFVIGKSKNPRCFIKRIPPHYEAVCTHQVEFQFQINQGDTDTL